MLNEKGNSIKKEDYENFKLLRFYELYHNQELFDKANKMWKKLGMDDEKVFVNREIVVKAIVKHFLIQENIKPSESIKISDSDFFKLLNTNLNRAIGG